MLSNKPHCDKKIILNSFKVSDIKFTYADVLPQPLDLTEKAKKGADNCKNIIFLKVQDQPPFRYMCALVCKLFNYSELK